MKPNQMLTRQTKAKHTRCSPVYSAVCWNRYTHWYNNTEHLITTSFLKCCININQTSEVGRCYYLHFKERKFWRSKVSWYFSVVKLSSWWGMRWGCGSVAGLSWFWRQKSRAAEASEGAFLWNAWCCCWGKTDTPPDTSFCLENRQIGVISNHIITPFFR